MASIYGPTLDRIYRHLPHLTSSLANELIARDLPNAFGLTYSEYVDEQTARLADLSREQLLGELILARSQAGRAEAALAAIADNLDGSVEVLRSNGTEVVVDDTEKDN